MTITISLEPASENGSGQSSIHLAPTVVVGHNDVACAGVRALLSLQAGKGGLERRERPLTIHGLEPSALTSTPGISPFTLVNFVDPNTHQPQISLLALSTPPPPSLATPLAHALLSFISTNRPLPPTSNNPSTPPPPLIVAAAIHNAGPARSGLPKRGRTNGPTPPTRGDTPAPPQTSTAATTTATAAARHISPSFLLRINQGEGGVAGGEKEGGGAVAELAELAELEELDPKLKVPDAFLAAFLHLVHVTGLAADVVAVRGYRQRRRQLAGVPADEDELESVVALGEILAKVLGLSFSLETARTLPAIAAASDSAGEKHGSLLYL